MNSFPGVNREPQEPDKPAAEGLPGPYDSAYDDAMAAAGAAPEAQATLDSFAAAGAFLRDHQYEMFTPSGFVHRSDLEILFGGPISDQLYYAIVNSVVGYVGTVLTPIIRPFILAIRDAYEAQAREDLTSEEDEGRGPRVIYVDEDTDINQVIKDIFENDTED